MDRNALTIRFWQVAILVVALAIWQWGYDLRSIAALKPLVPGILDPYFVSKPSEIARGFLKLGCLADRGGTLLVLRPADIGACLSDNPNNLWAALLVTLKNTFWGFVWGTGTGVAAGLVLGRSEMLARIFDPYIVAMNSIPRIALVPLIVLMFGLGDISKIVTAWTVVFFVVFFNTFEGARSVDRDHINAARLLGAGEWQVTRTVIVPSTMAWLFASLTPAVSFSLIGVIVGEFIGAEHGIGRMIIEAEARGEAAGMMVAVFVLMIVGVILAAGVRRIQAYLLRWRPASTMAT